VRCYARNPLGKLAALLRTSWLDFGERKGGGKGGKGRKDGKGWIGKGEGKIAKEKK